jgi:glycosyltransferase involved in cell wall biosynthesis
VTTAAGVLALIPAHDEAPRIRSVIAATARHLPVLVVDDGSTDGTATEAKAAGAAVIRQHPNQGKGAALRTGFRKAIADGYGAVLTLDADGQHDPAEIPSFLQGWRSSAPGPDLVIGRRDFGAMPFVRRLSNRLGGWALAWAVGRDIPDNQSGYRLISRRLMEATLASDEAGFEFEVEMIVTCIRAGWEIGWVPIRTIYAGQPSHIRPWRHFTSFVGIVRKARRTVRLPLP